MKLYLVLPEVAGQLGPNTIISNTSLPLNNSKITLLEYRFDGWLGSDILESFPCFIANSKLADTLRNSELSGLVFAQVLISKSEVYLDLHPDRQLPDFERIIPQGSVRTKSSADGFSISEWSGHDFCLNQIGDLVISEVAFAILKKYNVRHCQISESQDSE